MCCRTRRYTFSLKVDVLQDQKIHVFIESRCVTGPEDTRFQERPCTIQHGHFTSWGREGVNKVMTELVA